MANKTYGGYLYIGTSDLINKYGWRGKGYYFNKKGLKLSNGLWVKLNGNKATEYVSLGNRVKNSDGSYVQLNSDGTVTKLYDPNVTIAPGSDQWSIYTAGQTTAGQKLLTPEEKTAMELGKVKRNGKWTSDLDVNYTSSDYNSMKNLITRDRSSRSNIGLEGESTNEYVKTYEDRVNNWGWKDDEALEYVVKLKKLNDLNDVMNDNSRSADERDLAKTYHDMIASDLKSAKYNFAARDSKNYKDIHQSVYDAYNEMDESNRRDNASNKIKFQYQLHNPYATKSEVSNYMNKYKNASGYLLQDIANSENKGLMKFADYAQYFPAVALGAGTIAAGAAPILAPYASSAGSWLLYDAVPGIIGSSVANYGLDKAAGDHEGEIHYYTADGNIYTGKATLDKNGKLYGDISNLTDNGYINVGGQKVRVVGITDANGYQLQQSDNWANNSYVRAGTQAVGMILGGGVGNMAENLIEGGGKQYLASLATKEAAKQFGKGMASSIGTMEGFNFLNNSNYTKDWNPWVKNTIGITGSILLNNKLNGQGFNFKSAIPSAMINGTFLTLGDKANEELAKTNPTMSRYISPVLQAGFAKLGNVTDDYIRTNGGAYINNKVNEVGVLNGLDYYTQENLNLESNIKTLQARQQQLEGVVPRTLKEKQNLERQKINILNQIKLYLEQITTNTTWMNSVDPDQSLRTASTNGTDYFRRVYNIMQNKVNPALNNAGVAILNNPVGRALFEAPNRQTGGNGNLTTGLSLFGDKVAARLKYGPEQLTLEKQNLLNQLRNSNLSKLDKDRLYNELRYINKFDRLVNWAYDLEYNISIRQMNSRIPENGKGITYEHYMANLQNSPQLYLISRRLVAEDIIKRFNSGEINKIAGRNILGTQNIKRDSYLKEGTFLELPNGTSIEYDGSSPIPYGAKVVTITSDNLGMSKSAKLSDTIASAVLNREGGNPNTGKHALNKKTNITLSADNSFEQVLGEDFNLDDPAILQRFVIATENGVVPLTRESITKVINKEYRHERSDVKDVKLPDGTIVAYEPGKVYPEGSVGIGLNYLNKSCINIQDRQTGKFYQIYADEITGTGSAGNKNNFVGVVSQVNQNPITEIGIREINPAVLKDYTIRVGNDTYLNQAGVYHRLASDVGASGYSNQDIVDYVNNLASQNNVSTPTNTKELETLLTSANIPLHTQDIIKDFMFPSYGKRAFDFVQNAAIKYIPGVSTIKNGISTLENLVSLAEKFLSSMKLTSDQAKIVTNLKRGERFDDIYAKATPYNQLFMKLHESVLRNLEAVGIIGYPKYLQQLKNEKSQYEYDLYRDRVMLAVESGKYLNIENPDKKSIREYRNVVQQVRDELFAKGQDVTKYDYALQNLDRVLKVGNTKVTKSIIEDGVITKDEIASVRAMKKTKTFDPEEVVRQLNAYKKVMSYAENNNKKLLSVAKKEIAKITTEELHDVNKELYRIKHGKALTIDYKDFSKLTYASKQALLEGGYKISTEIPKTKKGNPVKLIVKSGKLSNAGEAFVENLKLAEYIPKSDFNKYPSAVQSALKDAGVKVKRQGGVLTNKFYFGGKLDVVRKVISLQRTNSIITSNGPMSSYLREESLL